MFTFFFGRRAKHDLKPLTGYRPCRPKLLLECLEDRTVLSGNPFPLLAPKVNTFLTELHNDLGTLVNGATVALPVVGKSLKDLAPAKTAIQQFQSTLVTSLSNITDPATGQQKLLTDLLPKGAQSVDVTFANDGDDVTVSIHLQKALGNVTSPFFLGLPGMPFSLDGNVSVTVGYDFTNLVFGLHNLNANTFFVNPGSLEVTVGASLQNSQIEGDVGFLKFVGTDNGSQFAGSFVMDVKQADGLSNLHLDGNAQAAVNLHLHAGFDGAPGAAMPTVDTDLLMTWSLANETQFQQLQTFGETPSLHFNNVQLDLGSFVSQAIKPAVETIQILTEPLDPIFTLLDDGLPVISELDGLVGGPLGGDDGVSVLDLAGIASDLGVIPEPYNTLVIVAKALIEATNLVNAIDVSGTTALINFGDFDVGDQQPQDLREYLQNSAFAGKDINADSWSDLVAVAGSLDFSAIKNQIKDIPVVGDQVVELLDKFIAQTQNGVNLDFPILDNFGSVISGFLLGIDSDMVSFSAELHNLKGEIDLPFPLPIPGLDAKLTGSISGDFFFRVAYDTYGFREILAGAPLTALADGFYFDPQTHLSVAGSIKASASIGAGFFKAGVDGGLAASLSLNLNAPSDNGDGKFRFHDSANPNGTEFDTCFYETDGAISGFLNAYAEIGVEVLGEFIGVRKEFNLAEATLINLSNGCINPFDNPPVLASFDPNSPGTLLLNLGPRAADRGYKVNEINESFVVTHDSPGSNASGESVFVSAFGFTQKYEGVKKIKAWGGSGNDVLKLNADVTAPVEMHGDGGNDQLSYLGMGTATLWGDAGDDAITGGQGPNFLYGDDNNAAIPNDGDDLIHGGAGTNKIFGEGGNDYLVGGLGANDIKGGDGNDQLFAGPVTDVLDGGAGNDTLTAGAGQASFFGNRGDDTIVWDWQKGIPLLIDGGGPTEKNTLAVFLSEFKDTLALSKSGPQAKLQVKLVVPNFLNTQYLATNIQKVAIEGGLSSDTITVNDLTNSTIHTVGVNSSDILSNQQLHGDGVADHVIVNATTGKDAVSIDAVTAIIQSPQDPRELPKFGGIMRYAGLPTYKVYAANINDDHQFYGLQQDDNITVLSVTGPLKVFGNDGNDAVTVKAAKLGDYFDQVTIDAGTGILNKLTVDTTASAAGESLTVTQSLILGKHFPAINYEATGGKYQGGVFVNTGAAPDTIYVKSTLPTLTTAINTNGGNDLVQVSNTGAVVGQLGLVQGILTVDAGSGVANTLRLVDTTTTAGNQNVQITATQVTGFAGPNDTTPVNYKATGGALQLVLDGSTVPALNEKFTLNGPGASVVVNGNAGKENVLVIALPKPATFNGGDGDDLLTAGFQANKLDAITTGLTFNAGGGQDVFLVQDTAVNAGKTYSLAATALSRGGVGPLQFNATLEALNVNLGAFPDIVAMAAMPLAKGTNVNAGNGSDTVSGPDALNAWSVTAANTASLNSSVKIASVENLTGGGLGDRFVLANGVGLSGKVTGGGGNDQLDYSPWQTPVVFNLQTSSANGLGTGFASIEFFTGGTKSDRLISVNSPATWNITGQSSGTLNAAALLPVTFASVENLTAGALADVFQFTDAGSLAGEINALAGASPDTLDYSAVTQGVLVNLTSGVASKVGSILGFENASGGQGDDTLRGNATANVLKGGGGNDVLLGGDGADDLQGGTGRDLLIGGVLADLLDGGGGDDILIGGQTIHDNNVASLQLIMSEWTRQNASYDERTMHLRDGGGLNGSIRLNAAAWINDLAADVIKGGLNDDWFWADLGEIVDLNQPPERVT